MTHYSIYIGFRGLQIPATVHDHDSFKIVWFKDSDIVKDFGGQFIFHKDGTVANSKTVTAPDSKDFYLAVEKQLH